MHIFVISLEKSTDRRTKFDNMNSKYIQYTYHNAVDGSKLNIDHLYKNGILAKNTMNYSNGALGCALSHLQLWEKCIQLKEPIIIMEDDAIVSEHFNKNINNLLHSLAPPNWDIIQLNYNMDSILCYYNTNYEICNCFFNKTQITDANIHDFVNNKVNTCIAKLVHSFGTSAYIISPNGAKLLKEKCFPLDNRILRIPMLNSIQCFSIDSMMNSVYKEMASYVCVLPFVTTLHVNKDYVSTI